MENIGFSELMVILVVVLLLFGAKRLPEIGSSLGKGIREFKRSISDTQERIIGHPDDRPPASDRPDDPRSSAPPRDEPKRLSQ